MKLSRATVLFLVTLFSFASIACGDGQVSVSQPLVASPEEGALRTDAWHPIGTTILATTAVNLRAGPSLSDSVLTVVPTGGAAQLLEETADNGYFHVEYQGRVGYSYATYWELDEAPVEVVSTSTPEETERDAILARASSGVGFSYWWGGGRWTTAPDASKGACYGLNYNEHTKDWGADCSGYAAKVWQVPGEIALETQAHPYSTYHFYSEELHWSEIDRATAKPGDALVYRANGAGHIVIFEKDDPWGAMWVFEARDCNAGIVHNIRNLSSAFKAIRKAGI